MFHCRPRAPHPLELCMEDRKWYPVRCTNGFGRGKRTLPVAVGFFATVIWLMATISEPQLDGAGFPPHSNEAATCALPALLFSSAAPAREPEKRRSLLGVNVGNLLRMVPAAARALGDGIKGMLLDSPKTKAVTPASMLLDSPKTKAVTPASEDLHFGIMAGGKQEDERPFSQDMYLKRTGHRKEPQREGSKESPGILPGPSRMLRARSPGSGSSVAVIPLPSLGEYNTVFQALDEPLQQAAQNDPSRIAGPSWLFLERGQLRGVPYSAGDVKSGADIHGYYLPDEGLWTVVPPSQEEPAHERNDNRHRTPPSLMDSAESWMARSHRSIPFKLEGVPESLKQLLVFPEEDVLFVDKSAARAIAKAASGIASSVVNYPTEKSRALAQKFPLNQHFYLIPRRDKHLFDRFGMVPGRFLGEGSFGIVFEAKSSSGDYFAVKVCVQTVWAPMTPDQEAKLLSECERSELQIHKLFPPTVGPPTLFGHYRMVVPLLTGYIAHLPSVYPLGKNMYGTKVCALYPSAMCDLQQLNSSASLPRTMQMELTRNMVTVVARLHLLGIVHLDIKLANFLVDHQGRVLLSDFGLAAKKQKTQVMVSCRSGSPAFMSPEMIRCLARNKNNGDGKLPLSSKMDAFSLGVALYLIWCGVLPYSAAAKGSTLTSLIQSLDKAYSEGDRLSFHACPGGDLPDSEIKAIIVELLRVDPERRATALDIVRASTIFLKHT